MFKNFNKLEKSWIYYDIGNSAFTMMVSTIIPIWFNTLAANAGMSNSEYLAFWSYATSIATILVAIIGPVFGSIADNKDFKKPMFMFVLFVGVIGCALLGAVPNWILYLITYVIAKVCYQTSLVFYDSMLTDVTTPERMDLVSSQGYAWGYIGSCIPFVIALGLYAAGNPDFLGIMNEKLSIFLAFIVIAVWWFCVTIPLLKNYKQKYYVETTSNKVKESISRLGKTLVTMYRDEKKVFFFLLAFFFYIDGVYTIIDEAVAIGTAHGAYPKQYKPTLDFERLIEIKKATNNFTLVLHCSSGTDKELLKKACSLGINKVNVNNDLCQAVVKAIKNGDFEGNNAYFVYYEIKEAVRKEMIKLIGIYGSANKAWIPEIKQLPRIKEV